MCGTAQISQKKRKNKMTKKLLLLLLLCLLTGTGYAQRKLQMADVYSNGMVLPRNTPFSLRGKGRPRQPVFFQLAGLRDTTICNGVLL